ncbi:hypothetical protein [Methylomonas sp. UP202]|uniref:hypothetical protein n=1 Tax=Methylomonas sp. UP202 TaxID=3040943 RepID=UPI002479F5A6|nr:hypothetical protein [Methylomonas sp. UP202]WGS88378.1 hypothetical protein QC632_11600 [Methylomonas sp. UP202]
MRINRFLTPVLSLIAVTASAAPPVKCLVDGKMLYTDDAARCRNADKLPIAGNVIIAPKAKAAAPTLPGLPGLETPGMLDSILERFGLTRQDVADGWKTVMDARERGSWQAPAVPEEDR